MIKHDQLSLSELADKFAGKDTFQVFEVLIRLGKLCVAEKAENRPEMAVVYMNLKKVISSISCVQNETGKFKSFLKHYYNSPYTLFRLKLNRFVHNRRISQAKIMPIMIS